MRIVAALPVVLALQHTPPGGVVFPSGLPAAAQSAAEAETALELDRPSRRLIQQGLRNEGFDPGAPDGLFGPRTRGGHPSVASRARASRNRLSGWRASGAAARRGGREQPGASAADRHQDHCPGGGRRRTDAGSTSALVSWGCSRGLATDSRRDRRAGGFATGRGRDRRTGTGTRAMRRMEHRGVLPVRDGRGSVRMPRWEGGFGGARYEWSDAAAPGSKER